ncbi:hypothetical protein H0E87_020806, partial [Populus deltoides]
VCLGSGGCCSSWLVKDLCTDQFGVGVCLGSGGCCSSCLALRCAWALVVVAVL